LINKTFCSGIFGYENDHNACAGEEAGALYHLRQIFEKPVLPHEAFLRAGSCVKATTHKKIRAFRG